jgi:hypothetical protein
MIRCLIQRISLCAVFLSVPAIAQQAQSPLQTSLSEMLGKVTVQDVMLTGSANVIAGASSQTVPCTFRSTAAGSSRIDLSLSAGTLTDTRMIGSASGAAPTGTWTNGNGVHQIASHNLMTDSGWFFPALLIQRMISNPALTVVFVGQEGSLLHYQSYIPTPANIANATPTTQHLSQTDLYLDATTLLPTQLAFNIHPDSNAAADIPVLIQYQNYQSVNGVLVPLEVQEYLNNSLLLDAQLQTAVFNSGLTISTQSTR